MTGLPDNNGNDFIRGLETRACVNGMTKSDVERLKNALVKKILDDETVIDVTDDGSIIADSNGMFISVNGQLLGLSVDGEDVIPVTNPYLPEDANENPIVPPSDTIMTSDNIAVDPRIVHRTGNEIIAGEKTFYAPVKIYRPQNNNQLYVMSRGIFNRIIARNYTNDDRYFDEHFQIGTTYATSSLDGFIIQAFAPRVNKGDTSENQVSVSIIMNVNNDNTCVVKLRIGKSDGTQSDKILGSFDGTSWT